MKQVIINFLIKINIFRKYVRSFFSNKSLSVTLFHKLYYKKAEETVFGTRWMGVPAFKCPLDLWIYQEIIFETKPDKIIECGTKKGGTTFFLASICEMIGHGEIISIDTIDFPDKPQHKRITYLHGSSTSDEIVKNVKGKIGIGEKVMVILDSNHRRHHVLDELRIYNKLVTKGNYMIVEDTNINGHPVFCDYGPGPMEALNIFLDENSDFTIDKSKERYMMTLNPRGYLKKNES